MQLQQSIIKVFWVTAVTAAAVNRGVRGGVPPGNWWGFQFYPDLTWVWWVKLKIPPIFQVVFFTKKELKTQNLKPETGANRRSLRNASF